MAEAVSGFVQKARLQSPGTGHLCLILLFLHDSNAWRGWGWGRAFIPSYAD